MGEPTTEASSCHSFCLTMLWCWVCFFHVSLWCYGYEFAVYISIHPSPTTLSRAGSRGQQSKQKSSASPLPWSLCFWCQWFACPALTGFTCVLLSFPSFFIYSPSSTKLVPLLVWSQSLTSSSLLFDLLSTSSWLTKPSPYQEPTEMVQKVFTLGNTSWETSRV